jgi:hypothetical protein
MLHTGVTHNVNQEIAQSREAPVGENCPNGREYGNSCKHDTNNVAYSHGCGGHPDRSLCIPDRIWPMNVFQRDTVGQSLFNDF